MGIGKADVNAVDGHLAVAREGVGRVPRQVGALVDLYTISGLGDLACPRSAQAAVKCITPPSICDHGIQLKGVVALVPVLARVWREHWIPVYRDAVV